ncbi:uncharacterized protein EV422DRAFT_507363 [Fimicolochytrium jonesii]|uniref:uncharacterized protein n=1 Tax=Fimicolochytrium jonesii TaxID=1396493 RepID=UPI0022FDE78B|nr:uncharacterized protein EV422DRAFT_507363 [Fimicolochytrium jonesii]KAI8819742.1 hypothetical protein EV422DRAFT_507363 [Fimicolochytrium jonesii]
MLSFVTTHYSAGAAYFDVVFRAVDSTSPNTTPHVSRNASETDALSLAQDLRRLTIAASDNPVDPFTMTPVEELDQDGLNITDGKTTIRVDVDGLLAFVKIEAKKGTALSRIALKSFDSEGQPISIVLSTDVWVKCLCRGHKRSNEIVALVIEMCTALKEYEAALPALHANKQLFAKTKIYLNDLLTFRSDPDARDRLESDPAATYYLSSAYFSTSEVDFLLAFPTNSGLSFQQCVQAAMAEKVSASSEGRSKDYHVCTSHDLAPLVRDVFGIRKGFQEEKAFKESLTSFRKEWKKRAKRSSAA